MSQPVKLSFPLFASLVVCFTFLAAPLIVVCVIVPAYRDTFDVFAQLHVALPVATSAYMSIADTLKANVTIFALAFVCLLAVPWLMWTAATRPVIWRCLFYPVLAFGVLFLCLALLAFELPLAHIAIQMK